MWGRRGGFMFPDTLFSIESAHRQWVLLPERIGQWPLRKGDEGFRPCFYRRQSLLSGGFYAIPAGLHGLAEALFGHGQLPGEVQFGYGHHMAIYQGSH